MLFSNRFIVQVKNFFLITSHTHLIFGISNINTWSNAKQPKTPLEYWNSDITCWFIFCRKKMSENINDICALLLMSVFMAFICTLDDIFPWVNYTLGCIIFWSKISHSSTCFWRQISQEKISPIWNQKH